jgi:antitoxin (DNA-binding transcriptional repressor) of toxin-antitoxin stability system
MKTCTISQAKSKLGQLADAAIKGEPTIIARGGKLLILQAYHLPQHPDEFDALIDAGKGSAHRPLTPKVFEQIWKRGRALAKKA